MMKNILIFLVLLMALTARGQNRVTASITVTNSTTNGMTFMVNGVTQTFTNNTSISPSTLVLTNADVTGCGSKTNLLTQVRLYPYSQIVSVDTGSNTFSLIGNSGLSMLVTASAGYASISYSTQVVATLTAWQHPISAMPVASARTNAANDLVDGLNAVEQSHQINQNLPAASQLVGLTNTQTVKGQKIFVSPTFSNAVNYGAALSSPGSTGIHSEQFGSGAAADGNYSTALGYSAYGTNVGIAIGGLSTASNASVAIGFGAAAGVIQGVAVGDSAQAVGGYANALGTAAIASGTNSIAIGTYANASGPNSISIGNAAPGNSGVSTGSNATTLGNAAICANNNSTAIGYGAVTTADNQVMIGSPGVSSVVQNNLTVQTNLSIGGIAGIMGSLTASNNVTVKSNMTVSGAASVGGTATVSGNAIIAGNISLGGSFTNLTASGPGNFPAGSDIAFGRFPITSLANGVNSGLMVGTNVFVEVSGPSAAFTINGIANGRDGKEIVILNQTGQTMTIANESGTDPTPGNRVRTGFGGDVNYTNNPSAVTLFYSGSASRWLIVGHN